MCILGLLKAEGENKITNLEFGGEGCVRNVELQIDFGNNL